MNMKKSHHINTECVNENISSNLKDDRIVPSEGIPSIPIPRKTNINIFSEVTKYFNSKPESPPIYISRQPSPNISQRLGTPELCLDYIHDVLNRYNNDPSSKSGSIGDGKFEGAIPRSDFPEDPSINDPRQGSVLPYLGNNISVLDMSRYQVTSPKATQHSRFGLMSIKSLSFNGEENSRKQVIPILQPMPASHLSSTHSMCEGGGTAGDIALITESIRPNSWIMPFIIACAPPHQMLFRLLLQPILRADFDSNKLERPSISPRLQRSSQQQVDDNNSNSLAVSTEDQVSHQSGDETIKCRRSYSDATIDKYMKDFANLNLKSSMSTTSFKSVVSGVSEEAIAALQSDLISPRADKRYDERLPKKKNETSVDLTAVDKEKDSPMKRLSMGGLPSDAMISAPIGAFYHSHFMHSSWQLLGKLWLCRDPTFVEWEERLLYIFDNYLFEADIDEGARIIGFAALSESTIDLVSFNSYGGTDQHGGQENEGLFVDDFSFGTAFSPPRPHQPPHIQHPMDSAKVIPLNSTDHEDTWFNNDLETQLTWSDVGSSQNFMSLLSSDAPLDEIDLSQHFDENFLSTDGHPVQSTAPIRYHSPPKHEETHLPGTAIRVTCFTLSKISQTTPRHQFWLCGHRYEDNEVIFDMLLRARSMTVEDEYTFDDPTLYHITPDGQMTNLLGRGRFCEVRCARRRYDRSSRRYSTSHQFNRDQTRPSTSSINSLYMSSVDSDDGQVLEHDAVNRSGTNDYSLCALKLVSKEVFWSNVISGKERADALVREVLAQALVCQAGYRTATPKSPPSSEDSNIRDLPVVQIFSMLETVDGMALELELMQSHDLYDVMSSHGALEESVVVKIVAQLVEAIGLCQSAGIAHRDIKLSNITFPAERRARNREIVVNRNSLVHNKDLVIKLADFGLAGLIGKDGKLRGRCGTPGFVAPDIFKAGTHEAYSSNVDIFSLGVVTYILLCGYEPFYGGNDEEMVQANKAAKFKFHDHAWAHISIEAKDFIAKALREFAEDRLTVEEAKRHPWIMRANDG